MAVLALLLLLPAAEAGDAVAGQALYAANCTACHGVKGDGKGPAAVALNPKPTDFTSAAYWQARTDAQVARAIRSGRPGTSMTGFTQLSDGDLDDLVAYLRTLAPAAR